MIEEPVLSNDDLQSITWVKLKKHYEARLLDLRIRNDSDMDAIKTAALRGEIRAVKNSLALCVRDQVIGADED